MTSVGMRGYARRQTIMMRPYVVGEDLTGVDVDPSDTPADGSMIANNITDDPNDFWYISPKDFKRMFNLE